MKTKLVYLSLALLSALLLTLSWPPNGLPALLFVAFIPLFILEQQLAQNNLGGKITRQLFFYTAITFFSWNIVTVWWIKNASLGGAIAAFIINSLPMPLLFVLTHKLKNKLASVTQAQFLINYNLIFIFLWLAYEFINHRWSLSFPWLTLGNGFATKPDWVQWYSVTGVLGGTLWVLLTNILLYNFFIHKSTQTKWYLKLIPIALLLIPILLSKIDFESTSSFDEESIPVVIVQPNIDPYNEKFVDDYSVQLNKMLAIAETKLDSNTQYLLFPETAITEGIWENQIKKSESILLLQNFLKKYPKLQIITGANTAKYYKQGDYIPATASMFLNSTDYYDNFNTALQLDAKGNIQIYHKSKLVPGVENMPFATLMKPLEKFIIKLGGTTGGLGIQQERANFISSSGDIAVAPVICYESVYGDYVTDYIKNGAQFIGIITNDGWWGNTPGYQQHLHYASLRAIETNRYIARCANTGVSCFIKPNGTITQATNYWEAAVIADTITPLTSTTFYVRHGDYIGKIALALSIILIFIYLFSGRFNAKKA